ncbi:THAP domain-containing protein 2-like, partial [Aphis craccivora]
DEIKPETSDVSDDDNDNELNSSFSNFFNKRPTSKRYDKSYGMYYDKASDSYKIGGHSVTFSHGNLQVKIDQMWEKIREDGSRRLRCDAVPTKFFFTKEVSKIKSLTERKIKSPLKKNVSEENSLELKNQLTSININIIDSDQSNQCKINYESMFKKMIEYERHYETSNAKLWEHEE